MLGDSEGYFAYAIKDFQGSLGCAQCRAESLAEYWNNEGDYPAAVAMEGGDLGRASAAPRMRHGRLRRSRRGRVDGRL